MRQPTKKCYDCNHCEMCAWIKEVEEQGCEFFDNGNRWIPCSERLPEIGQKVLASTKKTVFTQVFKGYYSDPKRWAWENNSIKRIEAWQPLPMPWEGVDHE